MEKQRKSLARLIRETNKKPGSDECASELHKFYLDSHKKDNFIEVKELLDGLATLHFKLSPKKFHGYLDARLYVLEELDLAAELADETYGYQNKDNLKVGEIQKYFRKAAEYSKYRIDILNKYSNN